jgi:2'-5' RNA ligase
LDEAYQVYINRMARQTLPSTYQTQLQNIQKSPKFLDGQAVSFPGYSAITPPRDSDHNNLDFYHGLEKSQKDLLEQLDANLILGVPPSSFHLTIGDLIWDSAYTDAIAKNPDFDRQLQQRIRESFDSYKQIVPQSYPSQWQLVGLIVFPRAIAVGLVSQDESGYDKIVQLRRSIYQNPGLIALGIEQQYYFTAHVTLAYFREIPAQLDRDRLVDTLSTFNERWIGTEPQLLTIKQVQLRKFDNMISYKREPDWPVVEI